MCVLVCFLWRSKANASGWTVRGWGGKKESINENVSLMPLNLKRPHVPMVVNRKGEISATLSFVHGYTSKPLSLWLSGLFLGAAEILGQVLLSGAPRSWI